MVFAAGGTYKKFFATRMVELNQSSLLPAGGGLPFQEVSP